MSIEQTTQVLSRLTTPSHSVSSSSAKSEDVKASRQEKTVENGNSVPTGNVINEETKAENQAKVNQAVSDLNDFVQNVQRSVHFSMDEDNGETIVRVIDKDTNELIRQIPTEEMLNIAKSLEEQMASNKGEGLILKVQA